MKHKEQIFASCLLGIFVLSNTFSAQAVETVDSTISSESSATVSTTDYDSFAPELSDSSTYSNLIDSSSNSGVITTDSSQVPSTSEVMNSSIAEFSGSSSYEETTSVESIPQSSVSEDRVARVESDVDVDDVTPATVFGQDDRVLVKNPKVIPYKQNVFVIARFKNGNYSGSGAMIGSNKVLTAAHCLRNVKTNEWAESITVYPAFAGGYAPYGGATGWTYHILTSFKNDLTSGEGGYTWNKINNDIAVVTLSRSLPEVGFLSVTDKVAINQKVQVVGYPGEKGDYMYAASGPILEMSGNTVRYQIDMTPGNSGGPVLDINNRIVAINIAENARRNTGRRINQEALTLIDFAKNNRNSANGISKVIVTFRLYHPDLKYHLYTTDANEKDVLASRGWKYEGISWRTDTQGKPVYRLYHPGIKKHVYTTDPNEKNTLSKAGWKYEGITWYSSGNKSVYRLYHSGLKVHLYTMDINEKNVLSTRGWRYEGVAWNVE